GGDDIAGVFNFLRAYLVRSNDDFPVGEHLMKGEQALQVLRPGASGNHNAVPGCEVRNNGQLPDSFCDTHDAVEAGIARKGDRRDADFLQELYAFLVLYKEMGNHSEHTTEQATVPFEKGLIFPEYSRNDV